MWEIEGAPGPFWRGAANSTYRESIPGPERSESMQTELSGSAFRREANPNFANGSCIGAVQHPHGRTAGI